MSSPEPKVGADSAAAAAADEKPASVTGAVARLTLSRERLRGAMLPTPPKASAPGEPHGITAMANRLVDQVKTMPGAQVVLDAVQDWWLHHPLRTAGIVTGEAVRKLAAPAANRNPLMLVFGAVLLGAVLALTRPWRWILRPAMLAGLLPALASRAVRELPVDSLMHIYDAFNKGRKPATSSAATPTRAAPVAPAYPEPSSMSTAAGLAATRGAADFSSAPASAAAATRPASPAVVNLAGERAAAATLPL